MTNSSSNVQLDKPLQSTTEGPPSAPRDPACCGLGGVCPSFISEMSVSALPCAAVFRHRGGATSFHLSCSGSVSRPSLRAMTRRFVTCHTRWPWVSQRALFQESVGERRPHRMAARRPEGKIFPRDKLDAGWGLLSLSFLGCKTRRRHLQRGWLGIPPPDPADASVHRRLPGAHTAFPACHLCPTSERGACSGRAARLAPPSPRRLPALISFL